MKRLQLSHCVFWKAAQHLTSKNFSGSVPQENFSVIPKCFTSEKQVFMQESGYHSGLRSKDKDYKNVHISPFLPEVNFREDH